MVGWPSTIHSATALPAPPAHAMPAELNPAATNRLRTSGVSPRRKLLSGVKLSGPLTNFGNSASANTGTRWRPAARGSPNFSQSASRS